VLELDEVSLCEGLDLLSLLAKLTRLQELVLVDVSMPHGWPPATAAAAFSALTSSSSNMQSLQLHSDHRIPPAAWSFILGDGQQDKLPQLQSLDIRMPRLINMPVALELSHAVTPSLCRLTAPQKLCLAECIITSDILSALTKLTFLEVSDTVVAVAADYDIIILPILQQLRQLRELDLRGLEWLRGDQATRLCPSDDLGRQEVEQQQQQEEEQLPVMM